MSAAHARLRPDPDSAGPQEDRVVAVYVLRQGSWSEEAPYNGRGGKRAREGDSGRSSAAKETRGTGGRPAEQLST